MNDFEHHAHKAISHDVRTNKDHTDLTGLDDEIKVICPVFMLHIVKRAALRAA